MKNHELQKLLRKYPLNARVRISVDVSDDFFPDPIDPEWDEEDEAGRRLFSDDVSEVMHVMDCGGGEVTICCIKGEKNY